MNIILSSGLTEGQTSRLTISCYIAGAIYGVGLVMLGPVIPILRESLGLSLPVLGTLFTAVLVGFVILSVLSGRILKVVGWKKCLVVGSAMVSLGLGLFGISRTFPLLLTSSVLIGLGGGLLQPLSSALMTLLYLDNAPKAVNMSQVYFGVGAVAAPVFFRAMANIGHWPYAFISGSFLGILATISLIACRYPTEIEVSSSSNTETNRGVVIKDNRNKLLNAPFVALVLAMMCYTSVEISFWGWLPNYLEESLGAKPSLAAMAPSLFWITFIIGRLAVGKLLSGVGGHKIIIISSAFTAVSLVIFYFSQGPIDALALGGLTAFAMSPIWPTLVAYTGVRFKQRASTALGLVIAAGGVGGAIGPPALGGIAEAIGMRIGFLLISVFPVAILLLVNYSNLHNRTSKI